MLNLPYLNRFFMKKTVFFTIILIITGLQLSAQKTKDVLYLKSGSVIFGKLVEVSAGYYKMQTSDGSILIFPLSEVEKFTKEIPNFDGRKSEGFSFSLEAGLLAGSQNTKYYAPFSFNFLAGFTSDTKNTTSIGSGVEFIGRPYTPLFIEYKRLAFDKRTTPFIFIRGGAIFPLGGDESTSSSVNIYENGPKNYKGGVSIGFGSGISWTKADYETYLSFAYRYAHTSYVQYEYNRGDVTYNSSLNRLEIKFGFKF